MTLAFVLAIGALTAFAFATRFYSGRIVYWLPVLAVAAAWVLLVFGIGQTSHRIFSRPTSFPRSAHAQWLDVVNAAGIEPHQRTASTTPQGGPACNRSPLKLGASSAVSAAMPKA